jgi:SAM-dependent methyltransferase
VGSTGRVVATDIDLKFLQRVSAPNLEVRRHDITKDELEKNEYDLAHCRFLLMHMAEPEKVLRQMVDALRPGGWLVVEDHDLGSQLACDVVDPSLAPLASTYRVMFDCLRERGIADLYFGRRLRGLVEGLWTGGSGSGWVDLHSSWGRASELGIAHL